jgi:thiol:disulfide interchange protein
MISLSCMLILQMAATPGQPVVDPLSYDAALERSTESGRPLVVFVTADWCTACQQMKKATLGPLHQAGQLKGVEFAVVDFDRQRKLASRLVQGGPIPQLVRYDREHGNWRMRRLIGAQDKTKVVRFLQTQNVSHVPRPGQQAARTSAEVIPGSRAAEGHARGTTATR